MARTEQRILVASSDPAQIERLLPLLRRSNLSVRRAGGSGRIAEDVRTEAADLVIVAMPLGETAEVLDAARAPGSSNEHAALLAILDDPGSPSEASWGTRANSVLAADCSPPELQSEVARLLDVAPRADVRTPIRLRFGIDQPESPFYEVQNLSTSGLFIQGAEELPDGTEFAFQLTLPDDPRPVLGRARVVRHGDPQREGVTGLGACFLSIGGEGPERLRALVTRRSRETEREPRPTSPPAGVGRDGAGAIATAREIASRREELEEITPYLHDLLRRGLHLRFGVADWYVTGAELGLEALHSFYRILEKVYSGALSSSEADRRLADLRTVHAALTELARPEQGAEERVRIMLEIRRPLERLLFELWETGRKDGGEGNVDHQGMVAQLTSDIGALLRLRGGLLGLRRELVELSRFRYLFARKARLRRIREVYRRHGRHDRVLTAEGALRTRRGRLRALEAAQREIEILEDRLEAIHQRIYRGRFEPRASQNTGQDLEKEVLFPILSDVLVQGYEYLTRAYTAYEDALGIVGADPGLLERAARLAAAVEADDRQRALTSAGG